MSDSTETEKDNDQDRHVFVLNPNDNGGEQVVLTTHLLVEDEKAFIEHQELSMGSYSNSTCFILCGAQLTPKSLRRLAHELEEFGVQ